MRTHATISAVLVGGLVLCPTVSQGQFEHCDPDGIQQSGAIYRFCMPPEGYWNGNLVVYAHGFVPATVPLAIPEDQLVIEGISLPGIANLLGFAFATTSYSTNGFAVKQGVPDVAEVVAIFTEQYGPPVYTFLLGSSEGGLVTTLALEQYPEVFDGGISVCGPIGDFAGELNYVGDFHVLFDFFYPDVLPGDPGGMPQAVIENWETIYIPLVRQAIWSDVPRTVVLLRVARAPIDVLDPENIVDSIDQTVVNLLWYNVFATNDAIEKLGGHPYDNSTRWYRGSGFDFILNLMIPRFAADPAALSEIEAYYQTSGDLDVPMVTVHTLLDEVVPYWQHIVYIIKTLFHGSFDLHTHVPVIRYGHCNFTLEELVLGFATLYEEVTGTPLPGLPGLFAEVSPEAVFDWDGPPERPPFDDHTQSLIDKLDPQEVWQHVNQSEVPDLNSRKQ